jgi:hypothetical protein
MPKLGLTAFVSGGTACNNGVQRSTTLNLVCDRSVNTLTNVTMVVSESQMCSYNATIRYKGFCPLACLPGHYGNAWYELSQVVSNFHVFLTKIASANTVARAAVLEEFATKQTESVTLARMDSMDHNANMAAPIVSAVVVWLTLINATVVRMAHMERRANTLALATVQEEYAIKLMELAAVVNLATMAHHANINARDIALVVAVFNLMELANATRARMDIMDLNGNNIVIICMGLLTFHSTANIAAPIALVEVALQTLINAPVAMMAFMGQRVNTAVPTAQMAVINRQEHVSECGGVGM